MARREPRHPMGLKVHVMFELHRGTPDCVAHAYECVVPRPRPPIAGSPSPTVSQEEGHTQQIRERKVS
jgi:hypothetical protein